jgi:hypothetical protein
MPYENQVNQDFWVSLNQLIARKISRVWTALPTTVGKWNLPSGGKSTVHATPTIMAQQRQQDGSHKAVPMPEMPDVPVHYAGGGGFYITHPVHQGDEGITIFSARSIDGWWQNGGTQPRPDYAVTRNHSLSDGMFIPTRMSDKKKLKDVSQTSLQIRSEDGKSYIEMLPDGGGFNFVTAGGSVKIDGHGNVTATGEITRGFGTGDQVTVGQHTHAQPPDSDGDIEAETNKPTAGT